MWSNEFTVHGLFRTSRVLERADYVVVYLRRLDRYQVIKHRNAPVTQGEVLLVDENEHIVNINNTKRPIVLDDDYMALDAEGFVEW